MSNLFQVNRKIRDAFILNIRRAFTGDAKYPYVETLSGEYDFDNTKVVISDITPQESAFFPAIVIETLSGAENRYLGPDDLLEHKNNSFEAIDDQKFSSIVSTLTISIYTINDSIARDEIVDRIYDRLKTITDDIADNGIEIIRATFPAHAQNFQNDRWYYTARLTFTIYSEWKDDMGPGTLVASIPITLSLTP